VTLAPETLVEWHANQTIVCGDAAHAAGKAVCTRFKEHLVVLSVETRRALLDEIATWVQAAMEAKEEQVMRSLPPRPPAREAKRDGYGVSCKACGGGPWKQSDFDVHDCATKSLPRPALTPDLAKILELLEQRLPADEASKRVEARAHRRSQVALLAQLSTRLEHVSHEVDTLQIDLRSALLHADREAKL
jgi:hypothetical protein